MREPRVTDERILETILAFQEAYGHGVASYRSLSSFMHDRYGEAESLSYSRLKERMVELEERGYVVQPTEYTVSITVTDSGRALLEDNHD